MILEPGQQYKINLRSMNMFNVFMTVPKALTFKYCLPGVAYSNVSPLTITSVTIPVGNYTGYTLATLLTNGTTLWVSFDISTTKFKFWSNAAMTTPKYIVPLYQDLESYISVWQILGFDPKGFYYTTGSTGTTPSPGYSISQVPINLTGATQIQLWTNLSVYNIPPNGKLAAIPMSADYGQQMQYQDQLGQAVLVSNNNIQSIRICLKDEHAVPLADTYLPNTALPGSYEYDNFSPPWEIILSLERVGPSDQHSFSYISQ